MECISNQREILILQAPFLQINTHESILCGFHLLFMLRNVQVPVFTLMVSSFCCVSSTIFIFRWVHVVCALYVPGVAFGDIDKLRPVTLTEMNYSKYGAKASALSPYWCSLAMHSIRAVLLTRLICCSRQSWMCFVIAAVSWFPFQMHSLSTWLGASHKG